MEDVQMNGREHGGPPTITRKDKSQLNGSER